MKPTIARNTSIDSRNTCGLESLCGSYGFVAKTSDPKFLNNAIRSRPDLVRCQVAGESKRNRGEIERRAFDRSGQKSLYVRLYNAK